jgi:hypothetical protein
MNAITSYLGAGFSPFSPSAAPQQGKNKERQGTAGLVSDYQLSFSDGGGKSVFAFDGDPLAASDTASGSGKVDAKAIQNLLLAYLENRENKTGASSSHTNRTELPAFTGLTDNGARVDVGIPRPDGSVRITVTLPNGKSIVQDCDGDTRVTGREDGGVTLVTGGGTITYDSEGNLLAVDEGGDPLAGTDGGDVIIALSSGARVTSGSGNDTIINFAANAAISGGDGNDTIINAASSGVSISGGDGNDRVFLTERHARGDVSVDLGAGDDTLAITGLWSSEHSRLTIKGGDGNDDIRLGTVITGATTKATLVVDGGAGNDRIRADSVLYGNEEASINGGAGDDIIDVGFLHTVSVQGGGGKDVITVGTAINSVIEGGGAGSDITVGAMINSMILGGDGGDNIQVGMMFNSLILGDGALADLGKNESSADTGMNAEEQSELEKSTVASIYGVTEQPYGTYAFMTPPDFGDLLLQSLDVAPGAHRARHSRA